MSEANTLAVDFTNAEDVLQIFPQGALLTSRGVQWNGIHLEYYRHPPYEIPENSPKQHLILINTYIPPLTHYEQALDGSFSRDDLRQGEVIIIPANVPHWARWDAEHCYITLSLDPGVFNRYAAQLVDVDAIELVPHLAKPDPLIYGLGLALKTELESNQSGGRLYTDSLTTTLFTHLLRHYCARKNTIPVYAGGLPKSQLRQVNEAVVSNDWIGSWLFVIGSLMFTGDASIDVLETCSFRAVVRLLACLLFTVGCFLLMPQPHGE